VSDRPTGHRAARYRRPGSPGRFLPVALLALLVPGALPAADTSGEFAVDGVGSRPCSDFTEAQATNPDLVIAFAGWTTGFITGVNVFRQQTFDLTPFQPTELLLGKMAKYCAANPDEAYVNALGKLVASLMPGRLQTGSELVRAGVGDKAVFVYRSVLEDVHARLVTDGFALSLDQAEFDTAFAEALVRYQAAKGLPQTGLPDLATMNSLYP